MSYSPPVAKGCTLIYGNQRAYTVWIEALGEEKTKSPVGMKNADVYGIRFASDKSKEQSTGKIWLGQDASRLPYKAELITADHRLEANVELFTMGQK